MTVIKSEYDLSKDFAGFFLRKVAFLNNLVKELASGTHPE
jgi:hypothetical protein